MKTLLARLRQYLGIQAPGSQAVVSTKVGRTALTPHWDGPLLGIITRADLTQYPGWEALVGISYVPDPEAVSTLAAQGSEVETVVFLGTWCGDTRRELPRFFATVDAAGWTEHQITYIGLGRSKRDPEGRTEALQVRAVPTFVLFRQGKEIGRIVERPVGTLESDLAQIVSDVQPADCASL